MVPFVGQCEGVVGLGERPRVRGFTEGRHLDSQWMIRSGRELRDPGHVSGERAFALVFSVLALGAVLSRLARTTTTPFPLSTYPMFSHPRPRTLVVTRMRSGSIIEDAHSRSRPRWAPRPAGAPVHPGDAESRGAARGTSRVRSDRSARRGRDELEHVLHVELSTDAFDAVAYFAEGATTPSSRDVHARCDVPR